MEHSKYHNQEEDLGIKNDGGSFQYKDNETRATIFELSTGLQNLVIFYKILINIFCATDSFCTAWKHKNRCFLVFSGGIERGQWNEMECLQNRLTLFTPMSYFYTPWKRQKTKIFQTFSGGTEIWHWMWKGLI